MLGTGWTGWFSGQVEIHTCSEVHIIAGLGPSANANMNQAHNVHFPRLSFTAFLVLTIVVLTESVMTQASTPAGCCADRLCLSWLPGLTVYPSDLAMQSPSLKSLCTRTASELSCLQSSDLTAPPPPLPNSCSCSATVAPAWGCDIPISRQPGEVQLHPEPSTIMLDL